MTAGRQQQQQQLEVSSRTSRTYLAYSKLAVAVARLKKGNSTVEPFFRDVRTEMTPEPVGQKYRAWASEQGGVVYDDNELTLIYLSIRTSQKYGIHKGEVEPFFGSA